MLEEFCLCVLTQIFTCLKVEFICLAKGLICLEVKFVCWYHHCPGCGVVVVDMNDLKKVKVLAVSFWKIKLHQVS